MGISFWSIVAASVRYHLRTNVAIACGVAAATAVIVGALLVGDSVRGSLQQLTLDRLGRIDEILVNDRFFRWEIVDELSQSPTFASNYSQASGIILLPQVTVEDQRDENASRASQVILVGCDSSFWQLGREGDPPSRLPGPGEIILNQPLAEELGVALGDEVTVRLPKSNQVPADSPLAHKSDRVSSLAGLKVAAVIAAKGLGQFSLHPSQRLPFNAFVSLETIQEQLEVTGKVNSILVAGKDTASPPDAVASRDLANSLRLTLDDFGVGLHRIRIAFPEETATPDTVVEYFSLTTDRMLFSPAAVAAAEQGIRKSGGQPVLTYLANNLERLPSDAPSADQLQAAETSKPRRNGVPYSTVSAIDIGGRFSLKNLEGREIEPLKDDEIVLNSWTADQLGVVSGDRVRIAFFEPETTHGETVERSAEFRLKAITPLVEPVKPFRRQQRAVYDQRPALANDPDLTPEIAGLTDQESMDGWDPPFPFEYSRVKDEDEAYWDRHRTTPKAFVSLSAGQRLWGSRFGNVTSFRIPSAGVDEVVLRQQLVAEFTEVADKLGMVFIPIKRQQLEAARGATPFDMLFLALSFFVITAALLLVAVLFRLGVDRRAGELGILSAVGLTKQITGKLLLAEGALVSTLGAVAGVGLGIGYAWLMLAGLRTWWVGAITTPFLQFHWSAWSLIIGVLAGTGASLLTIGWAARQLGQVSAKRLLAGQTSEHQCVSVKRKRASRIVILILIMIAIFLAVYASQSGGMIQAGSFVGAGALFLTAELLCIWMLLRGVTPVDPNSLINKFSLRRLGLLNAKRSPGRSAATIALVATASFLIVALSSFRLAPTERGRGGFELVAESSAPLFVELNNPKVREDLWASKAQILQDSLIYSLRLRSGDDASCNNLYQASQPRVIGITDPFIKHYDDPSSTPFVWAAFEAGTSGKAANPWWLLVRSAEEAKHRATVPVVLDKNTALYSLHLYRGIGEEFEVKYDSGQHIRFRVAGLLDNSILQGALLISEADFTAWFSEISGYRYFLVKTPSKTKAEVASLLENRLGDEGFDVTSADELLSQLLAVQNTYLSTFQSLGGLGLLLGTFGLSAIQLRNVFERRRELSVLRATGFEPSRLMGLVIWENVFLLFAGLGCGLVAAVLAVLPQKFFGGNSISLELVRDLAVMLGVIMLMGIATSIWASRSVLSTPLLASLRAD